MESFSLQDELASLANADFAFAALPIDEMDPSDINASLNEVVDVIANDCAAIGQAEVFDCFRSLLKHAEALPGVVLNKLLDSICSGFAAEIEATGRDNDPTDHTAYRSHKEALERYAYLLQWFVTSAEKLATSQAAEGALGPTGKRKPTKAAAKKGKSQEFAWAASIPETLAVMAKALRLRTERIWQTTAEKDVFVSNCFLKPANLIAESEAYMKNQEIKNGVYKVICMAAKNHNQNFNVQMTIMQNLQYTEHLSEPMAELVTLLATQFDYSQTGEEVLREIADKQFNAQDTKGPRSFSKFLIRLAEISPRLVLKQIALLQKHLDSESYPMRNAILEVIGLLIRELSVTEGLDVDVDPAKQKRTIEAFYDLLFERFLDLNSYVRSKVSVVLTKTCDLPSRFPKLRMRLTDLAVRSLQDKSSQVRKNCIALLSKLILTHPYGRMHGGELSMSEWIARAEALDAELAVLDLPNAEEAAALAEARELMRDSDDEQEGGVEEKGAEVEDDSDEEGSIKVKGEEEDNDAGNHSSDSEAPARKRSKDKAQPKARARKSDGIDLAAADQSQLLAAVDQDTLTRLRLTKKYYRDAISFIEQLDEAMPVVADLLASTVKSEVLEAIEFFRIAHEYKVETAETGVKRMLHLIWSKDEATTEEDGKELKGIRSRLIECYSQLYFEPLADLTPKDNVTRVAQNVIELTRDATLAELTSLEQLLGVMMAKGVVQDEVVTKLWAVYSTSKDVQRFQRRGAIIVLGMLAAPKPDMVADQVETLLKIGLGPHGKADLVLAKYTCIALGRVAGSVKKVKGSLDDKAVRLPMDSPVFTRLQDVIQNPLQGRGDREWFSMAEQAVNTIYTLGDQPDALCSAILREMTARVFNPPTDPDAEPTDETQVEAEESRAQSVGPAADDDETATQAPQTPSRFASQTPKPPAKKSFGNAFELSQLIFVAGHCAIKQMVHLELVERDLKRRKVEEDKRAPKTHDKDEIEAVAGSVEDDIGETIAHSKEHELLYGKQSLLAVYGPMAASIVSQPALYRNPMLKTAATLALSKFMCVSSKFCEDHLMMLFKVLETSREPAVRSNIVIALGDIAVCFSTIMDQNSDRLYQGLHDKDLTVKKNTLMVLTHLILNGMIKVKGQLGEMAKCLEDDDKRISDLAHLFFTELSTKEKAIYNNLPDIISSLSSGVTPVTEETFQVSMKFIFTFVDKKREAESIVEKLCQRFQVSTEPRQWRDIAYCLALLPFNSEVAVKKLVEGLPFYQDKLHEETVYKRFQEILLKARGNKATKNEQDLAEFEAALEEHRAKGTEDQEMQRKVQKSKKKAAATKGKATRSRRRARETPTPPSSPER